jgi:homoserine dehydrogenase
MERSGADFAEVLADAQARGFAEADPSFDIDGIDAAHKLAILASIAFGSRIDFAPIEIAGIRRVLAADIAQAGQLGYCIRLIGIAEAERDPDDTEGAGTSRLFQRVHPYLVPRGHPLAHVDGATNAVVAEGNFSGRLLFQGAGAGDGPTASAVVADLIDIARRLGTKDPWAREIGAPFSIPVAALEAMAPAASGHRVGKAYLRFIVADRPGVLAEIATAMRDAGVSIESLIQTGGQAHLGGADLGEPVLVAMVTHPGPERCIAEALRLLDGSPSLAEPPLVMHLLEE